MIAGQKPIVTKAKNSIAGFKLREGQSIGCKVTLRGDRMWEFFDRLLSVAIPRIRDFRGLPAHVVGRPWQLHVRPQRPDGVPGDRRTTRSTRQRGMDITIVTTATTNEAGKALLDAFGFPFKTGRRGRRRAREAQAEPSRPAWPVKPRKKK